MLTRHIQQNIKLDDGYQCTCFGDTEDPNIFYVMPETPQYATDPQGRPKFGMWLYRGKAAEQNPTQGGFCLFTVKLPMPSPAQEPLVKTKLIEPDGAIMRALRARADKILKLVQAKQNGDSAAYDQLQRDLGFTEAQAKERIDRYDAKKGSEQYLDAPATIKLRNVPITNAQAELIITGANQFYERQVNPAPPSRLGDNETIFNLSLTKEGAAYFSQALRDGEGSAAVAVRFRFDFEAMLPPVTVDVWYKATETREFTRSTQFLWGESVSQETIKDKLSQSEASGVKVTIPSTEGMKPDEVSALQKELKEWGYAQLEDIIKNKLGIDMSTIGGRFKDNPAKVSEQLGNVSDFSRTYSDSRVVPYVVFPQTNLPTMASLVGNDPKKLAQYFHEIELTSQFFERKEVNAALNAADTFANLGIHSVVAKLYYADNPVETLNYTATEQDKPQLARWYYKFDKSGKPIDDYEYSYEIMYRGEQKTFQSARLKNDSRNPVIPIGTSGLLYLQVMAQDIDWNLVDRAEVSFRYADQGVTIEDSVLLTAGSKNAVFTKPIFVPRDKPILYRTKFFLKDGQELIYTDVAPGKDRLSDWAEQLGNEIRVVDPFVDAKTYSIQGSFDTKTQAITIDLTYRLPSINYTKKETVTLSPTQKQYSWRVPKASKDEGQLSYDGFMTFVNGNTRNVSGTDNGKTLVQLGQVREDTLTVTVDSDKVDFKNRFKSAKLTLRYLDNEHGIDQKDTYSLRENDDEAAKWSVDLKDRDHKEYQWQLELRHLNENLGDGGRIFLPGPGKDQWGKENDDHFVLRDYIPDDTKIAEINNQLTVKLILSAIDWKEVDQAKVQIEYQGKKKVRQLFRLNEDAADEELPAPLFVAPLNGDVIQYQWQAEFKMDNGTRTYYPGPSNREVSTATEPELDLNEYIPEEFGGTLTS